MSTCGALAALALMLGGCSDDDDKAECGDGVIEGSESCDGSELGGATCESLGFDGGDLACGTDCGFDTSNCWDAQCGDGVANGNEECDDTDLDGTTCADLGHTGGDLACDSTCSFDESGCVDTCGDDTLDSDYEVCDGDDFGTATCETEGNFDGGDLGCSNDCQSIITTNCCNDQCTTDGALSCNGNILQLCETQANGCLGFTETDCTDNDQVCDVIGGTPMCTDACTSDCTTQGETYCDGTELWTCEQVGACLVWNNTDCSATGDVCFGDPAACVAPAGDCVVPFYLETIPLPDGTWDGTAVGDTSTVDASNHVDAAPCDNYTSGAANDWIYAIDVPAGVDATIVMTPNPSFDAALRLLATPCDLATEVMDPNDQTYHDGCSDSGNPETLHYIGLPAGRYYIVADGYSSSSDGTYDLRVTYAPTTCGNGLLDEHETCDDGNAADGDGCSSQCALEEGFVCQTGEPTVCDPIVYPSVAGDLVITEIMQNPNAVNDGDGEWFEIHNPTNKYLNLYGLVVSDADSDSFTVDASIIMYPGTYGVAGVNADTSTNGGVTVHYEWPSGSFTLANGDDELILTHTGVEIDRVEYDGGTSFPNPNGASMSLDPGSLNATDNDTGANWCETQLVAYGDGDMGTPGGPNVPCGTPTSILSEDFSAGIPGTWTIEDGGTSADTWFSCDPSAGCNDHGEFGNATPPYAMVDSDVAGSGSTLEEGLITPSVDCSGYSLILLRFLNNFQWVSGADYGEIQVSNDGGSTWNTIVTLQSDTADRAGEVVLLDISPEAAGQADVMVRFYYNDAGEWAWYWMVDDVEILGL